MKQSRNHRIVRLAMTTAIASATLAACTGGSAPTAQMSAAKAEAALEKGRGDVAVRHAEAAALATPRDASARVLLGNAYLEAGRFQSAAQAFQDAITLGDTSPRTGISLALARIGMGDQDGAFSTLNEWESSLDPADFGLAIALAGDPQRGIYVLSDALRSGQNTPKVRQNLAYAYALAGQWREARLMVAEDVPANDVGARMAEWGAIAHPGYFQMRVAKLLGVDVAPDTGQPEMLALSNHPDVPMMAAEAASAMPSDFALAGELPAIGHGDVPLDEGDALQADAGLTGGAIRFVSNEVVQAIPRRSMPTPQSNSTTLAKVAPAPRKRTEEPGFVFAKGDYIVQLGSYYSMSDAQAAWKMFQKRYPQLREAERHITKARVKGKMYYRVAAAGFARNSAQSMCASVKGKGGGCLAYASSRPLPGTLDGKPIRVASR
ncbi:MAG: SPOR domain-containing protein [Citromicrobium sp.]|nr:MAG: SPOR domain-containing protein [Citromicrobium sp.]